MSYALMTSGGKDSTLALDRALGRGVDVRLLVTLYDRDSDRVRFHGIRRAIIEAQARALGIEALTAATTPAAFESVFVDVLTSIARRGVTGVVFGNIHLADVRAWYEERVRGAGLDHCEPLWGDPPADLAREVVTRGFRALIVSADMTLGVADLVGRELDEEVLEEIARRPAVDPCGERGEYHSFVYDGPIFHGGVPFERGPTVEIEGHRFLDLIPNSETAGAR